MKLAMVFSLTLGLIVASAVNARASVNIVWKGITWGVNNNSVAVNGSGNLVMTGNSTRSYETYSGYGALISVYPYSGNVPGQSHATWDPGTFQQQWFQATYIDAGAGVGAAPYIMVEHNVPYRGLYISSNGVGSADVSYTGSADGGVNWYGGPLFTRTPGTHTIAFLLNASDSSLKSYYDGNLVTTFSSGFGDLESIYLGSFGASGQTLTYTDFQLGTNSLPPSTVPEPATIVVWSLLGMAVAGFGVWRRKRAA